MTRRCLLLQFDPRAPSGYKALANRPEGVPQSVDEWTALLDDALERAEDIGVATADVKAVEGRRVNAADVHLLADLNPPQFYSREDVRVLSDFLTRFFQASDRNTDAPLRSAQALLDYANEQQLAVRVGGREELELELNDTLAPIGRRGEPVDPAVLGRWRASGPPEFEASEPFIDALLVEADQLGIDTSQVGATELEIRRQPAPARLRLDDDIVDLLELTERVIAQTGTGEKTTLSMDMLARFAALLRFAVDEKLLLASRR